MNTEKENKTATKTAEDKAPEIVTVDVAGAPSATSASQPEENRAELSATGASQSEENRAEQPQEAPKLLSEYESTFTYVGRGMNCWVCLLISIITAMVSILSTSTLDDSRTSTVFIVFIGILIILYATYVYGFWGVIAAALSSLLFCLSIKTTWVGALLNVGANAAQALVMYLFFKFTDVDEFITQKKGMDDYKFILLGLGMLYVVLSFLFNRFVVLYVFFGVLVAVSALYSVKERSAKKILHTVGLCILPSLAGGLINSCYLFTVGTTAAAWYENFGVWLFGNSVLFGTFGYLVLCFLGRLRDKSAQWQQKKLRDYRRKPEPVQLKLSSIIYYVATLLWNVLFYVMYLLGWLKNNTVFYLFPWAMGNMFFLLNLYFTKRKEVESVSNADAFKWFENRAVVAEKNTQMLIAIIAFLLPLCANYLGTISKSISFIFVLNITAAVISIGLIWIPKNDTKTMEIIKNLKTTFHLYTLSLLLLNAIMIISEGTLL